MLHAALLPLLLAVAPPTPVASVEGVSEYDLPNGLRVLLIPDPSAAQNTVNLTVFVGSRNEDYGERGMAHLFEHMLFKKTHKVPDIKQALTALGGVANGTTDYDRTNYFELFPANDANLRSAIALESERLSDAIISREQLATELTVVRNELEMGESKPEEVLSERTVSAAYLWHNYGHSTIGVTSDIEKVPNKRLQAFYARYYQPDNAMLVIAGKLDVKKTLGWVNESFGKIPKPKRQLSLNTYTVEPPQDGERSVAVHRVGGAPLFDIVYHIPSATDPDFAPVAVLSQVLGASPSGRLYKAEVDTKKAATVSCAPAQQREPGFLQCSVELSEKDAPGPAHDAALSVIEGVRQKPVSAAEVDRAKTELNKQLELELNSPERVGLILSEFGAMGDWRLLFIYRDRLKAVTPDDVNRVAARYLKPSNRTLGEYVPTAAPDRAEVPALVDFAPVIAAYKPSEALAQGEDFDASPTNIEKRTQRVTLPSGLKLVLLSKRTHGQTVHAMLRLDYGTLASLTGQSVNGELAARMLLRGTKTKSHEQLKDALDKLNASVHVSARGGQDVTVGIEVRRPQLAAALDLVMEALQSPAFDEKEFEALRREVIAEVEQQKEEPMAVGFQALERIANPYPNGHPYAVLSFDEVLGAVRSAKREDARAFHDRFYGAQDAKLVLVGDFDPKEVTSQVTKALGSWKAPEKYVRIPRAYQALASTGASLDLPEKANAFFGAVQSVQMKDTDPDFPSMAMADYLLGGGFMTGRVPQRLREKEGMCYGAGTQFEADGLDDFGLLQGYAIYAPQNMQRVEKGFVEEVARAVTGGFSDAELKGAREGLAQQRAQSRADDRALVHSLLVQAEEGRSMAYEADLDAKLQALTAAQVGSALKRHLDPTKLIIVKAGDLKRATAK
jgi:zinc protease